MDFETIRAMALENGFSYAAPMDCALLELRREVREMCAANTCGMYGKNLACPPACGTLEQCREQVRRYSAGVLVQTVGDIEDSMDFEAMLETEARHKKQFYKLAEELRKEYPRLLPPGERLLHHLRGMRRAGGGVPLSGKTDLLPGGLWDRGQRPLQGKRPRLLLRAGKDRLHLLLSAEIARPSRFAPPSRSDGRRASGIRARPGRKDPISEIG